jgi:hypothetical protein
MSSSKSRKLKQKRRYRRTQVTIIAGSNLRFQNSGERHDPIASPLQIRSRNTSVFVTQIASIAWKANWIPTRLCILQCRSKQHFECLRHLVFPTDASIHVVDHTREAVWGQPLGFGGWVEEDAVEFFWRGAQDAMQSNGLGIK